LNPLKYLLGEIYPPRERGKKTFLQTTNRLEETVEELLVIRRLLEKNNSIIWGTKQENIMSTRP
jgi:ABC-type phosphate transport system ATPase subunit